MRVLLIDDSPVYRHILSTGLADLGYSLEAFPDAETALPVIRQANQPMLLLVDWELPGMSGVDLLSQVRQLVFTHYVYVLVLTGRSNKADLIRALDEGADDYLAKPFDWEELRARIRVANRTLAVHDKLVAANERLEHLASQDVLTDLLNRRAFMAAFHRERLRAQRKALPLVLVMCDIDHFKHVNDNFGHAIGDEAIKLVSRLLQESSRGSDIVARLGGDELVLLLSGSDEIGATALVRRTQKRLHERKELREVPITLSFGITQIDVSQPEQQALEKADAALYAAKRAGRDRYFVSGSDCAPGICKSDAVQ